jgi:integrase
VARAIARDYRRQLEQEGGLARPADPADADPAALVEAFQAVNAAGSSERQAEDNARHVQGFLADMGIRHPAAITAGTVQEWFAKLSKDGQSPRTLWNKRASLSRFSEFLIDREVLAGNPCRRLRLAKKEKLPPRFLSEQEYAQALELAKKHGVLAEVATALYTGMRRDELRSMEWLHVDFDRGVVIVPRSKSRRPRQIPMSKKLRPVLEEQQNTTGDKKHVFPGEGFDAFTRKPTSGTRRESWWVDAMKPLQAAMPIFTEGMADQATGRAWHLFRHTFASRLVQAGVPLAKVSAWLGHASINTTMIYAHLAPGHDKDINRA